MKIYLAIAALAVASISSANISVFFGSDENTSLPNENQVERGPRVNSDSAFSNFSSALGGSAGIESFEGLSVGFQGPSTALNFGSGRTGSLQSTSTIEVFNQPTSTLYGFYPADGSQLISINVDDKGPNVSTVTFDQDTRAFGFYINDLELNKMKVKFNYLDSTSETKDILLPIYAADAYISGNIAFWGGISDRAFRSVEIITGQPYGGIESVNFDKFAASPVPEPTTMAMLAGAGLLALRRRRK